VLQGFDAKLLLLDGKPDGQGAGGSGEARGSTRQQSEQRDAPGKSNGGFPDDLDDDVPF
jgi:hypothetical protein